MGNCVFKGYNGGGSRKLYDKDDSLIKVVTPNGGVMELHPPIFADFITDEFPGHVIHDTLSLRGSSPPLLHGEELFPGNIYYLLPISSKTASTVSTANSPDQIVTPYRMSFGKTPVKTVENSGRGGGSGFGVWKVRLVISPEQLADILAEDVETEALVESVRTVAKCGGGGHLRANSDQLSVSSSFKGRLRRNFELLM